MSGCFTVAAILCVLGGFLFPLLWLLAVALGILALVSRPRQVIVYTGADGQPHQEGRSPGVTVLIVVGALIGLALIGVLPGMWWAIFGGS